MEKRYEICMPAKFTNKDTIVCPRCRNENTKLDNKAIVLGMSVMLHSDCSNCGLTVKVSYGNPVIVGGYEDI